MVIRKDVSKLVIPIFTEQLFIISMGMINTMMAGHLGKEAVSAIGMVDSINNIFIAFFSALAVGGTVVVAQYAGRGNIEQANQAMKQALYSGLALTCFLTVIIWIFRLPLINILYGAAEAQVVHNATIYLGITLLTYPFISIDLIGNGILRGAGDTRTPMKITIFMNILNVVLSYFLIYGLDIQNVHFHFHLDGLGIMGAALGIAIARSVGAALVLFVLLRGSKMLQLKALGVFKLDMELLRPIFGIGIPASVESLLFNTGKLLTQIYIVSMGTVAIASNAVTGSLASMLNIPGTALSITATVLVGQHMGRGESEEAGRALTYLTKLSTICLVLLGLLSIPAAPFLSRLYTQNAEIIHLTVNLLRLNAVCIPLWSLSFVLPAGFKGAGDVKYTMVTAIIGMWIFRITLGYLLGIPLKLGLMGVWMGMYTDWFVRGILYYFRLRTGKWKEHVVIRNVQEAVQN